MQVDSIDFYSMEEEKLLNEVETEKVRAYQRPLGMAFVTLSVDLMAEK